MPVPFSHRLLLGLIALSWSAHLAVHPVARTELLRALPHVIGVIGCANFALFPRFPAVLRALAVPLLGLLALYLDHLSWSTVPSFPTLSWAVQPSVENRILPLLCPLLFLPSLPAAHAKTRLFRWVHRGILLVAAACFLHGQLTPAPYRNHNLLPANPPNPVAPVVIDGTLREMAWTRTLGYGRPLLVTPELVRNEWTIGALAQGMYEAEDLAQAGAGRLDPGVARTRSRVRSLLWTLHRGTVATVLWLRAAFTGILPVAAGLALFGWFRRKYLYRLTLSLIQIPYLLPPVFTLVSVAVLTAFRLPDGQGHLLPAFVSAILTLLAVLLCCTTGSSPTEVQDA